MSENKELATVHYLPEVEVVDGEVVSEADYRRAMSQREQAMARWQGYRSDVVTVARATRTVATHTYTKAAIRELVYVPIGAGVVAKRVWEARTNSRYERMMRAAEAAGNWEELREWEARAVAEKQRRHARRMDLVELPFRYLKALGAGLGIAFGGLVGLGIVMAAATRHIANVVTPLMAVVHLINALIWVVAVAWGPLVLAAPWLGVLGLWHVGRRHRPPSSLPWFTPEQARVEGEPVTPARVVLALRDLGIASLRKAIEQAGDGAGMMLGPIRTAGCGVEVDVTLPSGVSTAEIRAKGRKLAENLDRHAHELHITIPPAARTVRLWIADSGALDEPIGPSPLVTDDTFTADMFSGRAPWGQDLRGDPVAIPLWQRHLLITGLSNQGKTAALRALLLWAAHDRSVEIRLADLKGVGDWRMFDGIATVLIQGPTDEHVMAATHMVEDGVTEMERRLTALEESGASDGITREMSRKPGGGFHPLILVVDEAQQAFMCPAIGPDKRPYGGTKHNSRYFNAARKIHNQGRAVNVHLWQGTQDPTDQNLPKLVREGAHIRASLVVGTKSQAEMALGEKAVNAGAAPHELRQGLDKGTLVVTGDGVPTPQGQSYLTVRTHFISGQDATAIAERVKRLRGQVETSAGADRQQRDHLADVAAVIRGERRPRTEVIRQRLAELDRSYEGWTAEALKAALAAVGVPIRKSDGVKVIREEDVHQALADRAQDD